MAFLFDAADAVCDTSGIGRLEKSIEEAGASAEIQDWSAASFARILFRIAEISVYGPSGNVVAAADQASASHTRPKSNSATATSSAFDWLVWPSAAK